MVGLAVACACAAVPAPALAAQATPAGAVAPTAAAAPAATAVPDQAKGYNGADLPAAPTVNGNVITVSPANAQYTLDGAYGSIDGKTIRFSSGSYGTLVLGRPSKYTGAQTTYHTMKWDNTTWVLDTSTKDLAEYVDKLTNVSAYERTLENVTFTAEAGATVEGFEAASGYVYVNPGATAAIWNCVLDAQVGPGQANSYYGATNLKNITFDGLTIKNSVSVNNYPQKVSSIIDGLTVKNCTFEGDTAQMAKNGYTAINLKSDKVPFSNIQIEGNAIANYFQGLYVQGSNGLTVSHNVITNTTHNALAVQSTTDNPVRGATSIMENVIKKAGDRAIRVGNSDPAASLTVENNAIVDSGDAVGQNFKAGALPTQGKVSLENNYWSGKEPSTAVDNAAVRPAKTGIAAGTFSEDVTAYVQKDKLSVAIAAQGGGAGAADGQVRYLVGETATNAVAKLTSGQTVTVLHASGALTLADGVTVINKSGASITVNGAELADGAQVKVHVHSFSSAWEHDGERHWHACVVGDGARADEATHTWGAWAVTKAPTATEGGTRERTCTVCGYTQVETIPATGTNDDDDAKQPTKQPVDDKKPSDTSQGNGKETGKGKGESKRALPQTGDEALVLPAIGAAAGALVLGAGVAGRRRQL